MTRLHRLSLRGALVVVVAGLTGSITSAHHSAAAYDMESSTSVTGSVVNLTWRNPHVLLSLAVPDDSGENVTWVLETTAPSTLAANGWSRDALSEGTTVTAEIHPTKLGDPAGVLRWVTLENGVVLPIDPESPAGVTANVTVSATQESGPSIEEMAAASRQAWLERRAAADARNLRSMPESLPLIADEGQPGAFDPENIARMSAATPPFDLTGVWQFRRQREYYEALGARDWDFMPLPAMNAETQAFYDETMAARAAGVNAADPTALCYPPGMPRLMTRIGNFALFQSPTAIHMVHRFNNEFRTIFLDGRDHVDSSIRQDSYNGDSIGIWEEDTLFVETVGFGQPNQFVQAGIPMGPRARLTERWRLINDGNTLEVEFVITNPDAWEGEWVDTKLFDRILGADIREASCIAAEDAQIPGSTGAAAMPEAPAPTSEDASAAAATDGFALSWSSLIIGAFAGLVAAFVLLRRR
jgi:hypothetical protein